MMSSDDTVPPTPEEYKQTVDALAQALADVARMQRAQQEAEQLAHLQQVERQRRLQAKERDRQRRQSMGQPSTPAPAVSALTETAAGRLNTSTPTRRSFGSQPLHRVAFASPSTQQLEEVYGSEEDDEKTAEPAAAAQANADSEYEKKKQEIIGKAMRKIPAPDKFKGDSNDDKDKVEAWCTQLTNYLDGQFYGIPREDVKAERMTHVLGLLDKPASTWVNNMYSEEKDHSWEQDIMPLFINIVRDGRDTPAALKQRMESLAYGRGKCRDILSFNQEFETLRVKLYPTSSTDVAMSRVMADAYGNAIRRGDSELYVEALRFLTIAGGLNPNQQPELSEWKAAAAEAARIRGVQREAQRSIQLTSGGRGGWRAQPDRAAVNQLQQTNPAARSETELLTSERQEGEQEPADGPGDAQANAAGVRRQGEPDSRQQRPRFLAEDEMKKLMAAGRCFKCYGKGHRASDATCPGKGKPNLRRPTAEELKA
jgi:hypothetical protein